MTPRAAAVTVPGSTSNLGPGFDTLGLAVSRRLEARFERGNHGLEVVREGTLSGWHAEGPDLAVDTFRAAFAEEDLPAGRLHLRSDIPVGRGLGSSAAARVAGAVLARLVQGERPERTIVLEAAARAEGHPDNAAPAVLGGLVASAWHGDELITTSLPLSPAVGFAFAEPGTELRTEVARAALPSSLPHDRAATAVGRMGLLLRGLALADGDLIAVGLEDVLHVPYRLPLITGAERALQAAQEEGAWGATISGGGSGLLALCPPADAGRVAAAMAAAFVAGGAPGGDAFALRPDPLGYRRVD